MLLPIRIHGSRRYKDSDIVIAVLLYGGLAIIALLCLLPMWHVLMASLSDPMQFGVYKGFRFWPLDWKFSIESYTMLFTHKYLVRSYLNTIFYTFASLAIGLLISLMAAYGLSGKKMLFKQPLLILILITLFFNGGMVPFYIIVNQLGMIDTIWALILPSCCNAMNVVMLRNGILAIPDSICEAAEIDGAGPIRIMIRIVLPLCVPFMVVVALFNGIANWNSWVNASLFIRQYQELQPLQIVLRDILLTESAGGITTGNGLPLGLYLPGIRMAAIIVASLPLILIYPFLQKHFEKGVIIGSIKG